MKYLSKLFVGLAVILAFSACLKKVADLPFYKNGNPVVLTSSTNVLYTSAADSNNNVLTLNWTDPNYAQDSSLYKFVIEIDSTGRNFAKEYKLTATGKNDTAFTGKQLNDILAGLGVVAGVESSVDVRVTSSYGNNNEAYASNLLTIKTTPYIVPIKVTPSSTGPLTLSITNAANSAVVLNWNSTQYGNFPFTYTVQIDTAGGNFANPQDFKVDDALTKDINVGDLNTAALLAGVAAGSTNNLQIRVVAYQGTSTTPSVISDVINLKVTTYLPFLYLWIPGDYQGWKPEIAPQLGATVPDLLNFEGYVSVPAGGSFEFKMTNAPDWNHIAYGGDATTLSSSGGNLKWPGGAGYYYVKANPTSLTWSATKTTWAIIGDATPGGWGGDTPMTYDAANHVWVINSVALTANSLKFRANGQWDINLGGNLKGLSYGGDNISIGSAGNYKVVLDLSHPLAYTATITKL
jgi:hypothetical protein